MTNKQKHKTSILDLFYNLPINYKHLVGVLSCECLSVLILGIGSGLIFNQALQTQLLTQVKSKLTVTGINYNLKVNQISASFRNQAVNTVIVNAAIIYNSGQRLRPSIQEEIKNILDDEIKVSQIDYAILVSQDLKVIASHNSNVQDEIFNPDNLVSEALNNSQQIQANSTIKWSEISNYVLVASSDFKKQDVLIRYTVTPVIDKTNQTVIGALVAGDIVNGKSTIVRETLEAVGGGYSAVYLRKPTGEFALATSLNQGKAQDLNKGTHNLALPKEGLSLLQAATKSPQGKTVTGKVLLGNQTYLMAAKAIPNKIIKEGDKNRMVFGKQPVAILVQGIPEVALNNLLLNSWQITILMVGAVLVAIAICILIVKRSIIKPIQNLNHIAQKCAAGDVFSRAKVFASDEIGELAVSLNAIVDKIAEQTYLQENEAKLVTQVHNITTRLREQQSSDKILQALVLSTRETIQADRVIVYRLDKNWYGEIISESVGDSWSPILGKNLMKPYLAQNYAGEYEVGHVTAVDSIHEAALSQYYREYLEPLSVKAFLLVPIYLNKKLYGLLVAHQCSDSRNWRNTEINLFQQVATQVGYALEQAELFQQIEQGHQTSQVIFSEEQQQQETLQVQLLELLENIEGAARGNLTVRAEVTTGEIGTVADFFNSIVENLRIIVTKVKASAMHVNQAIGNNEGAIRHLAEEALAQAAEIDRIFDAVNNMTNSIQAVDTSAQQAATVANTAAKTAHKSGMAMDMTVQNILHLRETISETATKVRRLGESTQHISRVVALINHISMQTNLLAINAGIEASRAGEDGQGFAIVAEEVGELAAQSVAATQEIEQIVERIQLETTEVVQAMEQGNTQVVESTHIVADAKQNLTQIVEISRQIDSLVQSISQATSSQVETSQAIAQLMKDIAVSSQRTSDSSSKMFESLVQTLQIAEELQQAVGTFQVN
jgi:twitching motility protein PilJ